MDFFPLARSGYGRLIKPISALFRAWALARAEDWTLVLSRGTALVIAAHPDDETLGCGGLIIRKHEAGAHVRIVIATDGSASHPPSVIPTQVLIATRRTEALQAVAELGLGASDVTFLGHPDGRLGEFAQSLRQQLIEQITLHTPDQIFVNSGLDWHPDHQTLARTTRDAAVAAAYDGSLFEYPIWYWFRLPWTRRRHAFLAALWFFVSDPIAELFRRRVKVRTATQVARKRSAIRAHRTQVEPLPDGGGQPLSPEFVSLFAAAYEVFDPVPLPARRERGQSALY
jgi:LmbE family N-acetylglucosaminyl deacetylase